MSGESKCVWRGIVDDLLVLADFCDRRSPLSYQGLAQNAALIFVSKHVTIIVVNYKALSIDQFLTFTIKIFNEVNLYPTCDQSAHDQHACFIFDSFKYKTKRAIVRASTNLSTASLAGRPEWILTLSPAAVWTHSKGPSANLPHSTKSLVIHSK